MLERFRKPLVCAFGCADAAVARDLDDSDYEALGAFPDTIAGWK